MGASVSFKLGLRSYDGIFTSRFYLSKRVSTNLIKITNLWAFDLRRLDRLTQVDFICTKKNYRFSSKFDLYSIL